MLTKYSTRVNKAWKFLLLLFLTSAISQAQEKRISGMIIDNETQEPLPFANIVVGNNLSGSVSNADGYFVLVIDSLYTSENISFSYVGYHTISLSSNTLGTNEKISLKPATVNLKEVEISYKELSIKDILKKVEANFEKNHQQDPAVVQKVFLHKLEKAPLKDISNTINVKHADFEGLDEKTISELTALMPDEATDYNDAVFRIYSVDSGKKIIPIEAISLEEGSLKNIEKDFENLIEPFVNNLLADANNDDVYYKIKSGVFGSKIDKPDVNDTNWTDSETDNSYYDIETSSISSDIANIREEFTNIENKDLDFISKPGKYKYHKELSLINNEVVYKIHFQPKAGGTYQGYLFISKDDFGILQMDFTYADGKRGKHIQLLGVGYSENLKQAHVIFEKDQNGYFIKYINANKNVTGYFDRNLSFIRKEKRPLFNKQLNELKIDLDVTLDISDSYEYLVISRTPITKEQYNKIKEPDKIRYKREYVYSPEMWEKPTVIVPSRELQKYKRQQSFNENTSIE